MRRRARWWKRRASSCASLYKDMAVPENLGDSDQQLPSAREVFLDHVGHFVSVAEDAREALTEAGFCAAPISIQTNRGADGSSRLSGTGNVTAMLANGYIEVLFKTADTALGQEFDEAMSKYAGLHLAAFAVADANAKAQELIEAGFRMRPIVELRRPIETETGEAEELRLRWRGWSAARWVRAACNI